MCTNRIFSQTFGGILALSIAVLLSCNGRGQSAGSNIAGSPEEMQQKAAALIRELVDKSTNGGVLPDDTTVRISQAGTAALLYGEMEFTPLWSFGEKWLPEGDSLLRTIEQARLYGLFPEDYHFPQLKELADRFAADSLAKGDRRDAALWAKGDYLLTNAFVQLVRDVKLGRLPADSITLRKDSVLAPEYFKQKLDTLKQGLPLSRLIASLEPSHRGYHLLKQGIPAFLARADHRTFTRVPPRDAPGHLTALHKRLFEGGYIPFGPDSLRADSARLAQAIKTFQKEKNIAVDGKAGEATIRTLNTSDREKFIRIAISMDRYKLLPEKMPSRYIWVNASGNVLEVIDNNEVKLSSKVICGKPKTRTPVLSSNITSIITYPQWVPPPSIVSKEILPAVKKNPGYLARKGFTLVDSNGEEVDPYSVDWSKYSRGIPYRVVQGSGDANALGVIKFVFDNKYSVYLHDTNQRYLFANAMRSLSHGCVRVQSWKDLAWYILKYDSLHAKNGNYTRTDSVKTWLARKEKRTITVRNKIPVFIRYFTCEGGNKGIIFYDDVYAEDKFLREKYFATK